MAVIGGGIAGTTVAWELARRGVAVTLVEQRSIAHAASGRNMGLLLNQVEPEVFRIMQSSLETYAELEREGFDISLRTEDQLLLARDAAQLEAAGRRARSIEGLGARVRGAAPEAIRLALPALAGDIAGGWIVSGARALDPAAATRAFAESARRHGARLRTGLRAYEIASRDGRVAGVATDAGLVPAGAVVVATGPWLPQLVPGTPVSAARGWVLRTGPLGIRLPFIIEEMSWPDQDELGRAARRPTLSEVAAGGHDRPVVQALALAQLPGGDALLGTSMAPSLIDAVEGADMPRRIAERALQAAPGLAGVEVAAAWYGMRPMTPDGMPLAGPIAGCEGLYVHGGHGSIGMMTAPAIARWLVDGDTAELARLSPDRFAGRA